MTTEPHNYLENNFVISVRWYLQQLSQRCDTSFEVGIINCTQCHHANIVPLLHSSGHSQILKDGHMYVVLELFQTKHHSCTQCHHANIVPPLHSSGHSLMLKDGHMSVVLELFQTEHHSWCDKWLSAGNEYQLSKSDSFILNRWSTVASVMKWKFTTSSNGACA